MIFTFYSYKGGVGRSMALANIADFLRQGGLKVLIVDWDLEAPGIERFFTNNVDSIRERFGIMDLLLEYKLRMAKPIDSDNSEQDENVFLFDNINDYICDITPSETNIGKLLLITAGKRSVDSLADYANSVRKFDWDDFYNKWDGELFFEWLRIKFNEIADIVLIDSRTGVTEMGGVCTYQFADVIIMLCAANEQNLEGINTLANDYIRPELVPLRGDRPIHLLMIPARIVGEETDQVELFKNRFIEKFNPFIPDMFKDMGSDIFWRLGIPHEPWFAFQESLATLELDHFRSQKLLKSFIDIVLTMDILTAGEILSKIKRNSDTSFIQRIEKLADKDLLIKSGYISQIAENKIEENYDVFLSYSESDKEFIKQIADYLVNDAGLRVWLDLWSLVPGQSLKESIERAIKSSKYVAIFMGNSSKVSDIDYVYNEFKDKRIIPVVIPGASKQLLDNPILSQYKWIDLQNGVDDDNALWDLECGIRGISPGRGRPRNEIKPVAGVYIENYYQQTSTGELNHKKIINLPPRNPYFSGREQYLRDIESLLNICKTTALTQPVSVSGLGGVGKTQIALEYAHRHVNDYDIVWWIRSELAESVTQGYAELALELGLPEANAQDVSIAVASAKRYLKAHDKWLLIFDNIEDIQACYEQLPFGNGHILITSRDQRDGFSINMLAVEKWSRLESIKFLKVRLKRDDQEYEALTKDLGDFPLALEQASAYITERRISVDTFRIRYAEKSISLFNKKPQNYSGTVATTWSMAFDAVSEISLASDILNVIAWLAPDDIPRVIFDEWDTEQVDEAIKSLMHYSLINATETSLSVHRLVQAVIQERLKNDNTCDEWLAKAIEFVNDIYPEDIETDISSWSLCGQLQQHGMMLIHHAGDRLEVSPDSYSRLINQMGLYYYVRAEYDNARVAFEYALRIDEEMFGPDHPNVAIRINNLGRILQDLGDLYGARAAYERALKIDEAIYGPDHPNVATGVNNLGNVLRQLGNLPAARAAFESALKVNEAVYGPEHPNVATGVNNLGRVLQDLGDLDGARVAYERAIRIYELHLGGGHPNVATSVNNLGRILQDLGDLSGARAAYERAIKIDEAVYGPDHPSVAVGVNNLGSVLNALGDLTGARAAYERALKVYEEVYGFDHPNVATGVNNLGRVLQDLGDLDGARAAFERAINIYELHLGGDHPNVAILVNNLGCVLTDLGDLDGARAAYERAIKIDEAVYGPDHPSVANRLLNLGVLCYIVGESEDAHTNIKRAYSICMRFLGSEHPTTKNCKSWLDIMDEKLNNP